MTSLSSDKSVDERMAELMEETINFRLQYLLDNEPENKELAYEVHKLFGWFMFNLQLGQVARSVASGLQILSSVRQ